MALRQQSQGSSPGGKKKKYDRVVTAEDYDDDDDDGYELDQVEADVLNDDSYGDSMKSIKQAGANTAKSLGASCD